MDSYDKTYLDIDELAKRIEERIKELEKKDKESKEEIEYTNKETEKNIADLDDIIREIDLRISELEKEDKKKNNEKIDVDLLMEKVNDKLANLNQVDEEDLGKTLYDLSAISDAINETIKSLEEKRKKKKQQKAIYCDMARKKKGNQTRNVCKK